MLAQHVPKLFPMTTNLVSYDRAVHSDFLVHWTGKDIDGEHDPNWFNDDKSKTSSAATEGYLRRLRDILAYGLWMTDSDNRIQVGSEDIPIPVTPQCCFTELKLSESRRHARRYGRLGIGVKRGFLFERYGRPLAYYGFSEESHRDRFLQACSRELQDRSLMHFFKPMNKSNIPLAYNFYSESEWRILFFDGLLRNETDDLPRGVIDPRDKNNAKSFQYFANLTPEQQQRLKYLISLDGWFAMIIYPSLEVKTQAQKDQTIIGQITRIKADQRDHANKVERGNWPIELDLDACRNF